MFMRSEPEGRVTNFDWNGSSVNVVRDDMILVDVAKAVRSNVPVSSIKGGGKLSNEMVN